MTREAPLICIICANGNDLPEEEVCPSCGRVGPAIHDHGLRLRDVSNEEARSALLTSSRYFVSEYTDGPATRWNVIDRRSQEWIERFRTEQEANDYAAGMNRGKGAPLSPSDRGSR